MSREELIALVGEQARQICALRAMNEDLVAKLAKLEHLLGRNSGNSSMPPSKDDDPGRRPPPVTPAREGERPKRRPGKQPGAPGANLAWAEVPDEQVDRYPEGRCECGDDLANATDVGVVDRYQQHEIPQLSVSITQYDQHQVRCGCGRLHTAARPVGARSGLVGYGPNLQAFAVYLMVVHFVPAKRCVELLESLTGAAPSVGFVHGMLERASGLLGEAEERIRSLITQAHAVCADETPLRVGAKTPKPGRKKAEKYLLVACTELYTHYLLGNRDLKTFQAFVLKELTGSVVVHDRYHLYDSTAIGTLTHQLCTAHLLRDLAGAAETYPTAHWPTQIADALRSLIHHTTLTRDASRDTLDAALRDTLIKRFKDGVLVGLSDTTSHGNRPGERKARLLLEVLRDRENDVLRFAYDLHVPPTSNQAERDLRPAKIQQKISGRLTSEQRTTDRFRIRGYLSTAAKHGLNMMDTLREAILGCPWMPPNPVPT